MQSNTKTTLNFNEGTKNEHFLIMTGNTETLLKIFKAKDLEEFTIQLARNSKIHTKVKSFLINETKDKYYIQLITDPKDENQFINVFNNTKEKYEENEKMITTIPLRILC